MLMLDNAYVTILIENKTLTKATVSPCDRKICNAYKELDYFLKKVSFKKCEYLKICCHGYLTDNCQF